MVSDTKGVHVSALLKEFHTKITCVSFDLQIASKS